MTAWAFAGQSLDVSRPSDARWCLEGSVLASADSLESMCASLGSSKPEEN